MRADPLDAGFEVARRPVGDLHLNLRWAGQGPPLILLHGFPEYGGAWAPIARDLRRDHFCVIPDQRGYNLSDRPTALGEYAPDKLVGDVIAMLDYFSLPKAHLVGHDWGGVVAYFTAAKHVERIASLTVINAPHPAALQLALLESAEQRRASNYMAGFQQDGADMRVMADGPEGLWARGMGRVRNMGPDQRAGFIGAWSQHGAMAAMLAWYRDSQIVVPAESGPFEVPAWVNATDLIIRCDTQILWGMDDEVLLPELIERSLAYTPAARVHRIQGAGHAVIHQEPALISGLIRDFVAS